ncbi:GerMN domain-containing protein [Beduini massiliensis]|uniref:GerMN domain-containing protein n=1 Tax=Beduini massiliensis TaxID=1585974 RepID=UPI00059A9DA1|nr:GerMN domain-containing protein [Beduini massiliensis]
MRKKKIINTLLVCAFVLAVGFVYMKNKDTKEQPVSNVVYDQPSGSYKEVVYQDNSGLLIPVNIELTESGQLEKDVMDILYKMKESPASLPDLSPVLSSDLQVNSTSLNEKLLTIDFNSALLNLSKEESLKFIEALTWTLCDYKGIEKLHFTSDGNEITNLPDSYISLSANYGHNLGLNNFETVNAYLHKTSALVVYGNKQIDGQDFYVPVTKRIDTSDLSVQDKVSILLSQNSISSLISENKAFENLKVLDGTRIEDGRLIVNLSDGALLDEMSLNPQVTDMLLLSLRQIDGVETISFEVNGEAIGKDEIVSKNVVYNVVKM